MIILNSIFTGFYLQKNVLEKKRVVLFAYYAFVLAYAQIFTYV